MLIIRESQMQVFRDQQIQQFANDRLSDLADRFPGRFTELGEAGTMALVRSGVTKAFSFGIVGEAHVECVIDLMMRYGADFELLEELSFAVEPLHDATLPADARIPLALARCGLTPGFREEI